MNICSQLTGLQSYASLRERHLMYLIVSVLFIKIYYSCYLYMLYDCLDVVSMRIPSVCMKRLDNYFHELI